MSESIVSRVRSRISRLIAPLTVILFAGGILGATWQAEGMLAAQRMLINLIMPVGVAWLVSLFVAIHFLVSRRRNAFLIALFLFFAISISFSPILSRVMTTQLEAKPPPVPPLDPSAPRYRAVVVLGGGASLAIDGQPQLNSDGHRVVMAAQLWHADKVDAIICTGEDDYVPEAVSGKEVTDDGRDQHNPARLGVDLLVSLGVPQERLFRIGGVNTSEEMKNLSMFLNNPPASFPQEGRIGLITSAFHIPRAMRLAEREALDLVPIPVSYRSGPRQPLNMADFVPSVGAGSELYVVFREHLARLAGR